MGFAIGSAAPVSLALFGAYVSRAGIKIVDVLASKPGLMEGTTKPDYATCVEISTDASPKERIFGRVNISYCWYFLWIGNTSWSACWFSRFWYSSCYFSFKHRRCLG